MTANKNLNIVRIALLSLLISTSLIRLSVMGISALTGHDANARIESVANQCNNRGVAYFASHDYRAAIAEYNRGLESSPGNAVLLHNRQVAYRVSGQHEQASKDINRVAFN